uniref:F-box domain-containing protein n=1 Tax=Oryza glumipatula TaxID=40148 RepID=A0A0D9ZI43_9ORYZ
MAGLPALTDDVLAEILVRVPSSCDLARASAACSSFCRIATSPRFLRRFRSLHAPLPLGVLCPDGAAAFHPAMPPHPSAPAARALALAADFAFSFLPPPARAWLLRDHRDGRFLLDRALAGGSTAFTDVAVCDPLFRRYVLLPPIPDDLAASVQNPYLQRGGDGGLQSRSSEIFLASCGSDAGGEEPLFAVIWMACCRGKLVAFFFSSESQQWRALSPPEHYALSTRRVMGVRLGQRNHAHGCFYWMITLTHRWLVLDTRRMEFLVVDISPVLSGRAMMFSNQIITLESMDGWTIVVVADVFRSDKRCVLYFYKFMYFSDRWQLQSKINLPEEWGYRFRGIIGASEGYLFIKLDHPKQNLGDPVQQNAMYFMFDIKTMQLGRFSEICSGTVSEAYLHTGFPPSQSLPSV